MKLGAFVNSASVLHRPAEGRQRRVRADAGGVRRSRAPCTKRGRSARAPARSRRGDRRDRRGEALVHFQGLTHLRGYGRPRKRNRREDRRRVCPGSNAHAWDRLTGGDPFLSHAFLSALEDSGSVGPGTGWTPAADPDRGRGVAARRRGAVYLKTHSQGEYVFDHGWAEAWERAGGEYYPKLQVAVPFTPVPGAAPAGEPASASARGDRSGDGRRTTMSSAHITFIDDAGAAECRAARLAASGTASNITGSTAAIASFDDFLGALSSRKRKTIRKERAAACEGLDFRTLRGSEIGSARVGRDVGASTRTPARGSGAGPISRAQFFDLAGERMGDRSAAVPRLARRRARSRARSTSSARTRSTAAIGARSTRCRSSISSSAITGRSNGRSNMASHRSRRARRASTRSRAAMSR